MNSQVERRTANTVSGVMGLAALGVGRRIVLRTWRALVGRIVELMLVIATLALTRVLTIYRWRLPVGDVGLYHEYAIRFWTRPPLLHALPVEYPALAILPFSLTLWPPISDYYMLYAYWMGALVILGYLGFLRYSTRRRAVIYALYLTVGATATLLARFDIVPALLTLAALWATQRRHFGVAYVMLAVATLIKLYPILLLPVVLIADAQVTAVATAAARPLPRGEWARERPREPCQRTWRDSLRGKLHHLQQRTWIQPSAWRAARGATLYLGVVVAGFIAAALLSPANAFSSFFYLAARPLQVESIPASLLWLGTLVGIPAGPNYSFSSLNYVGMLDVVLKPLATVASLVMCGLVYARQARGRLAVEQGFLACLCIIIVTNKVLSPQYLIWVLPIVAAVEGFDPLWLAICILTTIDYPILYLTQPTFATVTYTPAFMPLLAVRNLLLIAITIRSVWPRRSYCDASASPRPARSEGSLPDAPAGGSASRNLFESC